MSKEIKTVSKRHFEDKILNCTGCFQNIPIPYNQIGGFWHLNGWMNKHGLKFYGGYCSECFDKLRNIAVPLDIKPISTT